MAFISFAEILDLIIMSIGIGFIFMDIFKPRENEFYQPLFSWNNLLFSALVASPGIILHELGHKVLGLFFGLSAVFHASYFGLGIGVFLKLINSGFIFFVPG